MISLLIAASVAFAVAVLGTPFLIRILKARGIGQLIRDDGPFTHPHAAKAGTPTMGGVALVGAAIIGYAVAHVRADQLKFARTGVSLLALVAVITVVGAANGVNLTDGMDGLAAGSATLAFAAFTIIGFWEFRHGSVYHVQAAGAVDTAVVAAAMMGACGGFLYWNAAPARIFMGDTGSLAIGGALAGLAIFTKTLLLLPVLGGLYVVETLSVIAQVVSFRGFGRRVLRMAPIHHHFEVIGWPEFTVIVRFWLFSGVCVALALGLFYADFINIRGAIG